jgi:uncharacterized membrane protein (UPF0182 family)
MNATAVEPITSQPKDTIDPELNSRAIKISSRLRWLLFGAVAGLVLAEVILGLIQKWLWMRQLDYTAIFWTLLSVKWGMFGVALILGLLYLWANLRFAARTIHELREDSSHDAKESVSAQATRRSEVDGESKLLVWTMALASTVVALFFAVGVSTQWDTYLRFRYGSSFGVTDPLFGIDLGFYFFRLPFYELLQGSLVILTVAALVILGFVALLGFRKTEHRQQFTVGDETARHLVILLFLLVATFGWGFYLDHYELVYSTLGVVYGAGYTAANVTRIALLGNARRLCAGMCASRICVFPSTSESACGWNWSLRGVVSCGSGGSTLPGSGIRSSAE